MAATDSPALDAESLVRAAPLLLRLLVAAGLRATGKTVELSFQVSVELVRSAASGASAAELIERAEQQLRAYLRDLLGPGAGPDDDGAPSPGVPERRHDVESSAVEVKPVAMPESPLSEGELRELGADLLRRSAELDQDGDGHPAYEHILRELAPDEARILRLLAEKGSQPAVDVRASGALGVGRSTLIAPGLNMIAREAGCLRPKRDQRYLNNLHRLGLIWFSREELEDLPRYQVLEAQPDVVSALEEAGRGAKTIRRSIHLTPFGIDFCTTCLPLDTDPVDAPPREVD